MTCSVSSARFAAVGRLLRSHLVGKNCALPFPLGRATFIHKFCASEHGGPPPFMGRGRDQYPVDWLRRSELRSPSALPNVLSRFSGNRHPLDVLRAGEPGGRAACRSSCCHSDALRHGRVAAARPQNMKCLVCQTENRDTARFCKGCGSTFEAATATATATPPSPTPAMAGTSCLHCGHVNRPGLKFCGACGKRIDGALPQAAIPQEATAPPPPLPQAAAAAAAAAASATWAPAPARQPEGLAPNADVSVAQGSGRKGVVAYVVGAVVLLIVAGTGGYYWTTTMRTAVGPATLPAPTSAPASISAAPPAESASEAAAVQAPMAPAVTTSAVTAPAAAASAAEPIVAPLPVVPLVAAPEPVAPAATVRQVDAVQPPKPSPKTSTGQDARREAPASRPAISKPRPEPAPAVPPPAAQVTLPAPDERPARRSEPEWYVGLKEELGRCSGKDNFISRIVCEQKAKLRFCTPGNQWGKVPECVQSERRQDEN